jgi:DNA-binding NarL/FixJ family response regulator
MRVSWRKGIMAAIRTAMIGMSPMFGDIVKRSVARYVALEVILEMKAHESLDRLKNFAPELVLICLNPALHDDIGEKILRVLPSARVIVFSRDKRDGYLYETRPTRATLSDISPEKLVKAISRSLNSRSSTLKFGAVGHRQSNGRRQQGTTFGLRRCKSRNLKRLQ